MVVCCGRTPLRSGESIRCDVCHDICPVDAARHDGERIPEEVRANLAWAERLLSHAYYSTDPEKQKQLIERLRRFLAKNVKVAEKTIEQLGKLQNPD